MIRASTNKAAGPTVLVGLAAFATFTNAPGSVIADARYEHLANPIQFLARHGSLWDDSRGLGQPAQFFSPVLGAIQALLQFLGAEPWVIQRLTHTLLLGLASCGAYVLARALGASPGASTIAGVAYAFNGFSSQFLLPSGLFASYAVAPWLALAAWRGVQRGADQWRWAGVFAVSIFAMGMLNTSSLLFATVPAAALFLGRWAGPDADTGSVWAWLWRTAVLTGGAISAMLVVLVGTNDVVRFNLETTETARTVASSSSASESWRGLGQWLSYLRVGGASIRDQSTAYFTDPLVIGAGFGVVMVAAAAMLLRPDRVVATLGAAAAFCVVLMVGIHPVGSPSPFGSVLEDGFDASLAVRGFRSTYKAGTGLHLALALLVGMTWGRLLSHPGGIRLAGGVAIVSVVLVAGFPFWTGNLYPTADRYDDIPSYWQEALEWFDDQPSNDAILVLPSAARTRYRWGYINDTLFDANFKQPVVSARTLPESTAVLTAVTQEIDKYLAGQAARPGALEPMLRRAGVRWIVLQNDIDWAAANLPRPFTYDQIRLDAGFALVATFGEPGTNTTEGVAFDEATSVEAKLAPVEVYEVIEHAPAVASVYSSAVVVAGAPDVWPTLASEGWLAGPVVLDALLTTERAAVIATADAIVITDGARRRAVRVARAKTLTSPILGIDQDVGRPVQNIFDEPDQQTVATYGDLLAVKATSSGTQFDPWLSRWWPSQATDRDRTTAWASAAGGRQVLELTLSSPTSVGLVRVTPYVGSGRLVRSAVSSVDIVAVDERGATTSIPLELGPGALEVRLPSSLRATVALRVEVTALPGAGLVGLTEVEVETANGEVLDGRQRLRTPGPSGPQAELTWLEEIGGRPVHQLFSRVVGIDVEESLIRREFWRPQGPIGASATVRVDQTTPDRVIDALLGSELGAVATTRAEGRVGASARSAIDGRFATAWEPDLTTPGRISLRVPGLSVDEIGLDFVILGPGGALRSRPSSLALQLVGPNGQIGETLAVTIENRSTCDPVFDPLGDGTCFERVVVPIDPTVVNEIIITLDKVEIEQGLFKAAPLQLAEVQLRSRGVNLVTPERTAGNDRCQPLLRIDGLAIDMRPAQGLTLDLASLQQGLRMVSCAFVTLNTGWHYLESATTGYNAVESVTLDPPTERPQAPSQTAARVLERSTTRIRLAATVESGDVIVTRVADHPGWKVRWTGPAGRRVPVDGFVAWQATAAGEVVLTLDFTPQRTYRLAWYASAISMAFALWLIVPGGPSRRPRLLWPVHQTSTNSDRVAAPAIAVVGFAALGWFVGGLVGLAAGLVVGIVVSVRPRSLRVVATIGPIVLAIVTVFEGSLDESEIGRFARSRGISHDLGLVLTVVWLGAAFDIWRRSNAHRTVTAMSHGRRSLWPLGVLIAVAIATVSFGVE